MKPPLNIHLYITPFCPVPCRHCYYEALPPGTSYDGQLSVEEMVNVINALDTEYDMDVHLEGGEALLSDDLPRLLTLVPEEAWRRITITTSGALKMKFDAALLRRVGDLRVSVEGMNSEQQYALRGIQIGGPEAFMRRLQEERVRFSVRSTLFDRNVRDWMRMALYAYSLGAARLSCYELQPVGRANETATQGFLSTADVDEFLGSLAATGSAGLPLRCMFQFPEKRREVIDRCAVALKEGGWHVQALADTPSLTINANGELGVSPWKITAQRVSDHIGDVRDRSWLAKLREAYERGTLHDDSLSTSRIRISAGQDIASVDAPPAATLVG